MCRVVTENFQERKDDGAPTNRGSNGWDAIWDKQVHFMGENS